jgi:hypothetical protein
MKMKRRFGKENTIETIGLRPLLNALPKQQLLVCRLVALLIIGQESLFID